MITQAVWFAVRENRVIIYYNCRDCGKPIPPERWELGLCEAHWRLFTRKDNPQQRRIELEKPVIESLSILDDISVQKIQFDFRPQIKTNSATGKDYSSRVKIKQAAKSKSLPAKAAETMIRENAKIQRRIELVVAEARKRKAAEIAKAEREAE